MYKLTRKIFKPLDLEKEEAYLTQMAQKGYILVDKRKGEFYFEKDEKKDLTYKVYFRLFKSENDFNDYVNLCKKHGWKLMYGSYFSGVLCFLLMNKEKPSNNLFPEDISKRDIMRIKRDVYLVGTALYMVAIMLFFMATFADKRFANISIYVLPFLILVFGIFLLLSIRTHHFFQKVHP